MPEKRALVGALALAAAALAVLCLAQLAPRPSSLLGPPGGPPFTVCQPDPNVLVWDTSKPTSLPGVRNLTGWLKVPIIYDQPALFGPNASLGFTAVRVAAATTCSAGSKPLLTHCGGPGTNLQCLLVTDFGYNTSSLVTSGQYDNFAITQRGIDPPSTDVDDPPPVPFFQADGVTRVTAFPVIECYKPTSAYALRVVQKAYADAGLNFAPVKEKLLKVSTEPNGPMAVLLDPDLVKVSAQLSTAASSECRMRPEYNLGENNVRGHMAYQDFAGTVDLAHDLDTLRAAVGAPKLSIWGVSYGTEVGANYATIFPDRVDRLLLDGNSVYSDNLYMNSQVAAIPVEQVWNGLANACDSRYLAQGGAVTEPWVSCAAAPYPTQKLYSLMRGERPEVAASQQVASLLTLVQSAMNGNGIMEHGIYPAGAVLMACVQSYYERGDYSGGGCCFNERPPEFASKAEARALFDAAVPLSAFRDQNHADATTLVRAVDQAERMTPEAISRLWTQLREEHPIGFWRASGVLFVASSPVPARPAPPFGSSLDAIRPLVVGELHDPATTYTSAQIMHRMFPNGALLTWQGYKHALPGMGTYLDPQARPNPYLHNYEFIHKWTFGGVGAADCNSKILLYLKTGELPRDGTTCPIDGPSNGDTLKKQMAIYQISEKAYCLPP